MSRHIFIPALIFAAIFALLATATADPPRAPDLAPRSAPATTVRVKTADELVKAIASDRIIELEEGDYALTDVQNRKMENVVWIEEHDGNSLFIRKVKNLKLVGVGKKPAHLVVRPQYVYVLGMQDCEDVTLENLKLGHAPEKGGCTCGVVAVNASKNITIKKCDLYGCGTEGLTLEKSQNVGFEDSTIRDCSYGILTVKECKNITLARSHLHDNMEYWGLKFTDSEQILLTDCIIENNRTEKDAPLFSSTSSSDIAIKNCTLKKNTAKSLTNPDTKAVKFEDCKLEENTFPNRPPTAR